MSMFSFPEELTKTLMPTNNDLMTDMMKGAGFGLPLLANPFGAAAAATAVGFGVAAHMTGLAAGMVQGAMSGVSGAAGFKPDFGWIFPDFGGDRTGTDRKTTAEVVELKIARKAEKPVDEAPVADEKPAKAKAKPAAKAKAAPKAKAGSGASVATRTAEAPEAATGSPAATDIAVAPAVSEVAPDDAPGGARVAVATPGVDTVEAVESLSVQPAPADAPAELSPEDFRRPADVEKPESPDDLKMISGVGPKLEQVLNGLGIWTFAQVASWTPAEVAWVDDYLQFKGRIDRDEWIAQADALARGGREEYVKVFGKEPR